MDAIIRRQSEHLDSSDDPAASYDDIESKKWEWTYLRTECKNLGIEDFYRRYVQRLEMSTLSLFLVIHLVIGLSHIIFLVSSEFREATPDVYAYAISIVCVFIAQIPIFKSKEYKMVPFIMSYITVTIIILTDIAVPIYHDHYNSNAATLRPAYSIYVILCIYIFLPITYNYLTVLLGFLSSACYLVVLTMITYRDDTSKVTKVISEAIVFIVLNLIGIHYRFMNEIAIRRTFLAHRVSVQTSIQLKTERDQEKDLLLSILPEHTAIELECDIRNVIQKLRHKNKRKSEANGTVNGLTNGINARSSIVQLRNGVAINKTYTEIHENVSVLYADIVNYTMITTELPVETLVEILHELFVKFDDASANNNVLRIKFLGDCYYAVSGVPHKNDQHAKSCVKLGLQMIKDIRGVRNQRNVNIDMRIGVHSGNIIAGVIGACKWQYDIWSKDVDIANKMESTGEAGKVHVSKETLDLLDNEFIYEEGTEKARNDPVLQSHNITTYLISPETNMPESVTDDSRRLSIGIQAHIKRSANRKSKPHETRNFMQTSMAKFRQLLSQTNAEMDRESEQMPVGRIRFNKMFSSTKQKFPHTAEQNSELQKLTKVSPFFLMFNTKGSLSQEMEYLKQHDLLLKYYVTLGFLVLLAIVALQILNQLTNFMFWIIISVTVGVNLVLIPLIWFKKLWIMRRSQEENDESNLVINPKSRLLNYIFEVSTIFAENCGMRYIIFLIIGFLMSICSLTYFITENTEHTQIDNTWAITHCLTLTLCINFMFTKIHFLFKLFTGSVIVALYGLLIFHLKLYVFNHEKSINPHLESNLAQFITLVALVVMLHLVDRQMEFISRVDYNAKQQLMKKQNEAEVTRVSNAILLQNILPSHVAAIYLGDKVNGEFYHEKYDNVAIMFAQITNYNLHSDKQGLSILNQIICDFDEMLNLQNSKLRLEKIKVAGLTYMVACGLDINRNVSSISTGTNRYINHMTVNDTGRRSTIKIATLNQHTHTDLEFSSSVSCVMIQFALKLMKQLNNRGGLLRVGISNGEVVAGVIGSSKPLYDVWGNTVNMASRMESTGIAGRIQVTADTAETLRAFNVDCEYRGETQVKGRGLVPTYWVLFDNNYDFIKLSDKC